MTGPRLEEFQFTVTPVLLQTEDGQVSRPVQLDPVALYGIDELKRFCEKFPEELARLNASQNGGPPD